MALVGSGSTLGGFAGGNATARLLVVVSGNTANLTASMAQASGSISSFEKNANRLGNSLIRGVTLPVVGLGAAALSMAAQYQTAMGRVAGLTTLTADRVSQANRDILAFSKTVPTSAVDLANSLYFAGSAGLSFKQAMDVTKLSAEGAAVGMGEASDISKVLIFALNAFSDQGLTAAQAMDTLTVAIKEGTAEPDQFAIALGRLLPIAHQAGLTFAEVTASVAQLTNIGLPVRVATTSLRALFQELTSPTQKATQALASYGITIHDLQAALKAGPLVAFNLLNKATGGQVELLSKVIPQIRGLTAFEGLSGDAAIKLGHNITDATHSVGAFGKAFRIISQTESYKFQTAVNKMRTAGIELGTQLFPVFDSLIGVIGGVADSLSNMGSTGRSVVVALALVAAAAGPLIKIYAQLITSQGVLLGSASSMARGMIALAGSALIAYSGFRSMATGGANLGNTIVTLVATFAAVRLALAALQQAALAGALGYNTFAAAIGTMGAGPLIGIAIAIAAVATAIGFFVGQAGKGAREAGQLRKSLVDLGAAEKLTSDTMDLLKGGDVANTFGRIAQQAGLMGKQLATALPASLPVILHRTQQGLQGLLSSASGFRQIASSIGDARAQLQPYIQALEAARGKHETVGNAIRAAGLDENKFLDIVGKTTVTINGQSYSLGSLVHASDAAGAALRQLQTINSDNIQSFQANNLAAVYWAKQFGVSTATVQGDAQALGVDLSTLDERTAKAFADAAGYSQGGSDTMGQNLNEMSLAAQKTADSINKAFDGIDFFKPVEKIKTSNAKIIANFTQVAGAYRKQMFDIQTLLAKGLDPGLIQSIVSQGPGMVAKFASMSAPGLQKIQDQWAITLAAVDNSILAESDHQTFKAQNMVANFADAIFSNSNLPRSAMDHLISQMTAAIDAKKISNAGVNFVETFAAAITGKVGQAAGITNAAAAKIISGLISAVSGKKMDFTQAGEDTIVALANGIVKSGGLPKSAAAGIVQALELAFGTIVSSAGDSATKTGRALARINQDIADIPSKKTVTVTANTGQAFSSLNSFMAYLSGLHPRLDVYTFIHKAPGGGGFNVARGGILGLAGGGIMGATGFITQGPVTEGSATVGEGKSGTRWGKGAESVMPLNSRGIRIMGQAYQEAFGGQMDTLFRKLDAMAASASVGGWPQGDIVIPVQVDGHEIARAVYRVRERRPGVRIT